MRLRLLPLRLFDEVDFDVSRSQDAHPFILSMPLQRCSSSKSAKFGKVLRCFNAFGRFLCESCKCFLDHFHLRSHLISKSVTLTGVLIKHLARVSMYFRMLKHMQRYIFTTLSCYVTASRLSKSSDRISNLTELFINIK